MFYEKIKDLPRKSGIYCIDFPNGKKYIGLSKNVYERVKNHIWCSNNRCLQTVDFAIKKYGFEGCSFRLLEECEENFLEEKEVFWIRKLNTFADFDFGYNMTSGGNSNRVVSEETKKKQKQNRENDPEKYRLATEKGARTVRELGILKGENHPLFGIGHSEKAKKRIKENHADCSGCKNSRAKEWKLTSPNGEEFTIKGELQKFCLERNIAIGMLKLHKNKVVEKTIKYKISEMGENTYGWKLEEA